MLQLQMIMKMTAWASTSWFHFLKHFVFMKITAQIFYESHFIFILSLNLIYVNHDVGSTLVTFIIIKLISNRRKHESGSDLESNLRGLVFFVLLNPLLFLSLFFPLPSRGSNGVGRTQSPRIYAGSTSNSWFQNCGFKLAPQSDVDITLSDTHNNHLPVMQRPIIRARARQLNLEVISFLCSSL